MARFSPVFVQTNTNLQSLGLSVACAFPSSVTLGNLLVVQLGYQNATNPISSVVDTQGNTYTQAHIRQGSGCTAAIYYAQAGSTGANTVTVTTTGSNTSIVLGVSEWSGASSATVHKFNGDNHTSTSHSHGSITTTTYPTLIVTASQIAGGSVYLTGPTDFTLRVNNNSSYGHDYVATDSAGLTTTATYTTQSSENFAGVIVAFQETPKTAPGTHVEWVTVAESVTPHMVGPDSYWLDGVPLIRSMGEVPVSAFWLDGIPFNFAETPEAPGTHYENIAVAEAVTAALSGVAPTLNTSRFDTISVVEAVMTRTITALRADRSDSINVAEFVKCAMSLVVKVNDAITVVDQPTVTLRPTLRPSVFDAITVTDVARVGLSLGARVSDSITVAEAVVTSGATAKAVTDTISVTEFLKVVLTPTVIRVNDRVTVTDGRTAALSGPLSVFKFETITVTEGSFNPKVVLDQIIIDSDLSPTPFGGGDYWVEGIT